MIELFFAFGALFSTIVHDIDSTSLVDGGEIRIATSGKRGDRARVVMDYAIDMKWYAPVGDQKGRITEDLPAKLLTEEGYLDLKRQGRQSFKNVDLQHLGWGHCVGSNRCHKVRVRRKDDKWEAVIRYHPSVGATGWATVELTYNDIPGLGSHTITSRLRE